MTDVALQDDFFWDDQEIERACQSPSEDDEGEEEYEIIVTPNKVGTLPDPTASVENLNILFAGLSEKFDWSVDYETLSRAKQEALLKWFRTFVKGTRRARVPHDGYRYFHAGCVVLGHVNKCKNGRPWETSPELKDFYDKGILPRFTPLNSTVNLDAANPDRDSEEKGHSPPATEMDSDDEKFLAGGSAHSPDTFAVYDVLKKKGLDRLTDLGAKVESHVFTMHKAKYGTYPEKAKTTAMKSYPCYELTDTPANRDLVQYCLSKSLVEMAAATVRLGHTTLLRTATPPPEHDKRPAESVDLGGQPPLKRVVQAVPPAGNTWDDRPSYLAPVQSQQSQQSQQGYQAYQQATSSGYNNGPMNVGFQDEPERVSIRQITDEMGLWDSIRTHCKGDADAAKDTARKIRMQVGYLMKGIDSSSNAPRREYDSENRCYKYFKSDVQNIRNCIEQAALERGIAL